MCVRGFGDQTRMTPTVQEGTFRYHGTWPSWLQFLLSGNEGACCDGQGGEKDRGDRPARLGAKSGDGGGEASGPGETQRARWLGHRPLRDLTASNSASDLGLVGTGH